MNDKQIEELTERLKKRAEERRIKYPIEVKDIKFDAKLGISKDGVGREKPGDMVMIRSCKEGHGDKTRLGIFIGYVSIHGGARFERETGTLTFEVGGSNPAIFVPELNEVVLGCESWWGRIDSEKDLKQITDEDINNVWYVKAMKQLAEAQEKKE